jgi:serine/threonine-protein kinase
MSHDYRTFGSYILFDEVRQDVLGRLYRGAEITSGGLGRRVWVRTLEGAAVPGDDVRAARDTAERVAAVLKAANIATDASYPVIDGIPSIVCTHVPSQPLGLLFEKADSEAFPVPVDNSLLILEKLALALTAALAVEVGGSSLAHGFLHPGLILVTHDGEAVVMGFGVADQLLGTLEDDHAAADVRPYLAPEVLVSRTASKRGDVYSLGAILFQLLTGQPLPADADARGAALESARLAEDEEPLPADLRSLLSRALASRPEERFSSAADFKKELDKLLYGGAYSPTTFNLALFMDRLFRTEIEAEEKAQLVERDVDVSSYLAPAPAATPTLEPVPEEFETAAVTPSPARGGGRGLWIGLAAVAMIATVASVAWFMRDRAAGPVVPPTPTAEEIAAQKQAEDERLQAMIQELVQQRMAEKETEIRDELTQRQQQIEDLRRRLQESEKRASAGQVSDAERQRQEELQRQIDAAEAEQRLQEEALAAERQQIADAELSRLADTAPDEATGQAEGASAAAVAEPTATPLPSPTATPKPTPAPKVPTPVAMVTENSFYEPPEVDTLPVVLREEPVEWPRVAHQSRQRGMVIMQATVNADGVVEEARVLRTDHDGFGIPEAALEAVRKYRFKPGTKDGVRITTYATVTKRYDFFRDR